MITENISEMRLLSVLVPVYNEEATLATLLGRVVGAPLPPGWALELLVVDDGSTDASWAVLQQWRDGHPAAPLRMWRHAQNRGKGAALHTGIGHARGEFLLVQDADLEYDPCDYPCLLGPLLEGRADVVFGSRLLPGGTRQWAFPCHAWVNRLLTRFFNHCTGLRLTDMATGYKIFPTAWLQSLDLRERGFGFEPEVAACLTQRPHLRLQEVPVNYRARSYRAGKKIGWRDAWRILHRSWSYRRQH